MEMSDYNILAVESESGVTRRGFLKGALASGVGVAAMASFSPEVMARALLAGKTAADITGAGTKPGVVDLDQNENPLGPSPLAVEAVKAHIGQLNRYMNDFPIEMFIKLNMMVGVSFEGLNLQNPTRNDMMEAQKRNRIGLAPGSGELLRGITLAALENGGHVLEAEGGYGDVSRYAETLQRRGRNVTITRTPLTTDKKHDLKAMQKAVTADTKLVVITNPNNPTGTLVSHEEIGWFVDNVPSTVRIVIDEAYIDFVKDPTYKTAAIFAISKPNVVVTRTFSKIFGLAGLRIGFGIGAPDYFDTLELYVGFPQNVLTAFGAAAALNDTAHVQKSKETVWAGRDYLSTELKKMGVTYTPSESNFMLIDVSKDPQGIAKYLRSKNVMVRVPDMWGFKNHIRVSIGTQDELEVFINTFKEAMANAGT